MEALKISSVHWNEIVAHVLQAAPEEGCGLLAGEGGRVQQVFPVENMLHSPTAFEMEHRAQIESMEAIDRRGWELIALFHSHPGGPAVPSATDIRQAYYPETITLILSPVGAGGWQGRAYRIDGGQVIETEVVIE